MTPTATRRLRRAACFGQQLLDAICAGQTGKNLRQNFLTNGPADLNETPEGHTARCWGIETPPCRSATAAIQQWARMATEQEIAA